MSNSTIASTSSVPNTSRSTPNTPLPPSTTPSGTRVSTSTPVGLPTTAAPTTPSSAAPPPTSNDEPTPAASQSMVVVSSSPPQATTVIVTSTSTPPVVLTTTSASTSSSTSSSSSSTSGSIASSTPLPSDSGGLSSSGKIALAVVVPVVGVALIVLALLFLWRKRKQRRDDADERRKEVEEYGYNPNNDPTLPAAGGMSDDGTYEMREEDNGYRGWGAAPISARKPSNTVTSGSGPIGMAFSDNGNMPAGYSGPVSPTHGSNSEVQSGDPLINSHEPYQLDTEPIGALGAGPVAGNRQDMHRGPSNASSSYSAANRSDASGEAPIPIGNHMAGNYHNEAAYYDEQQQGPYADGSYGAGQPVIRDVPARRNTRIENPSIVPPQGNAGIAQNF
ncbi:MAG: hypothetical protein M1829_004764 [Trizodia sp. TS-e1964]|nr:MAG: hypothetical protein M1829_004764 [Trizodia sp. TS-e1964]